MGQISIREVQRRCRSGEKFEEAFYVLITFPVIQSVIFSIVWDHAYNAPKVFPVHIGAEDQPVWKIRLKVDTATLRLIRRYFMSTYKIRMIENVTVIGSEKRVESLLQLSRST